MFGFFNFRKKSYTSNDITTLENFSNILRLTNNYGQLAKAGYIENVISNTCIRKTAQEVNSIPFSYYLDGEEVEDTNNRFIKSIIKSVEAPNFDCNKKLFLESILSSYMIKGEAYCWQPENSIGEVSGFEYLRPDKITKTQSTDERAHKYVYSCGSKRYVFTRDYYQIQDGYGNGIKEENPDTLTGDFNFIRWRTYNPFSEIDGQSPLKACGLSVDGHNKALEWNNSIMTNSGKPSGVLSFGSPQDGMTLGPEQIQKLDKKLHEKMTGNNRGRILTVNGQAKFEKFSMTSQEMDFIQGIVQRSIDICNALDFPPYLLGFVGATYNNQAEAKMSLYENSALPKFELIYGGISEFISKKYDIDFKIKPNLKKIIALAPRYEQMNKNLLDQWKLNVIDQNEIRTELGYETTTDGDGLYYDDIRRMNVGSNFNPET